ncbi:cupin domain-containing protein [Pseudotabrizicola sp. L79]|uniref:cupin domain-containing protein n=1 Tax=Pseudotabrizicola sp. L79 TaxID=3118402 RepID=UPI002F957155
MPHFTPDQITQDSSDGTGTPCGPYRAHLLSDTGGLTQFGAFIEILPPGSRSALKHWHAAEDELIYMLAGVVTLCEGDSQTVMRAGDTATFKAGTPIGHCLENHSTAEARYLVVGTRAASDVVTYPDHDRVLRFDRASQTRHYTSAAGQPANSPYDD